MKEVVSAALRLVSASLLRTGLPVPAPRDVIYSWARGSGLPRRGDWVLYTGGLYQLAPYIKSSVELLSMLYSMGRLGLLAMRVGEAVVGRLPLHVFSRPPRGEVERARRVLLGVSRTLSSLLGGRLGYLYERDLYPGTIAYEYGLEEVFRVQAERVARAVRESGARRLVTVDPHTTRILRSVIPQYVEGFDVEVKSYLELLDELGYQPPRAPGEAAIHDPCLYARFEGVIDQPRRLLAGAGLRIREPPRSGRLTYCCGGPIEGIMPRLAKRIASTRAEELVKTGRRVVVMCPLCAVNLEPEVRARGGELVDIAEILAPGG